MRFGDLELSTVINKNHKRAVLTVNDRTTSLCWPAKLEEKESEPLMRLLNNPDNGKGIRRAQGVHQSVGNRCLIRLPLPFVGTWRQREHERPH